jgi:serine/threonine protein kinase
MSPEQAQGFSVDERTDIWALGLVLYEMLAGRHAYPELPSYEQFIIHLVSKPPDPLSRVAPWVPEELASVVHGALEHDTTKRIQSGAELVKRLIDAHPIHSGRISGPTVSETTDTWSDPRTFDSGELSALPRRGQSRSEPGSRRSTSHAPASERAHVAPLESSGVRGNPAVQPSPPEDFEDDAPQFFDRKLLQTLDPPPSGLPKAIAAENPPVAHSDPGVTSEPSEPRSALRLRRGWAGLALLVLGLVVVAALAWR